MKKLLLILFFCQLSLLAQHNSEKYHRAKIVYQTVENLKKLQQLGLPMDHGIHKVGYSLTSDFSDFEIQIARNLGLEVTIEIEDVQKFYVEQNNSKVAFSRNPQNVSCSSNPIMDYQTPSNFNYGAMGGYFTYAEMLQELDDMRSQFPNLISAKTNVGTFLTSENRALQSVKITKNPESINTRPQVLYTAVHHAREPISLSATLFYMWYLLENYATNDEVKNIVDNTEMFFIPVVNPDGYIYNETTNPDGGGMWRKNRRDFNDGTFGVDNNRNYDYWVNGDSNQSIWNTLGVSATTTGDTYPGTSAISEPENQAVQYFVENHNFKVALNAHTYSNLLLYPYGYDLNIPSPDDSYFNKISGIMVSQNGFTNEIASALYAASGDSDDFMYGQTMNHNKIFAFTPEIGSSFWPATTEIIPLCKQMMFTNLTAAKLVLDYVFLKDTSPQYLGNTAVVEANFELSKFGLTGNGNYTVSINPISSNIISVGVPFTINNMQTSDVVNSSIQLGIAAGTTSGDFITFEYLIDNGQFVEHNVVSKKFGQLQNVVDNNCSAIAPSWTSTNWGITTEAFVSPSTSITDSPNTIYNDNQNKNITFTNPINLNGYSGGTITFSAKWSLEKDYDFVKFQISNDNGVTWVSQCGKYTKLVTPSNGGSTIPVYNGFQTTWVNDEIDLSDYAGQTIKARFRLETDQGSNFDGFYFDDFKVNLLQNTILATVNSVVSQFGIYPNPTNSVLNINTIKNNYKIQIFNLQGQLLLSKENNNGIQNIDINFLNAGMYLIELKSDSFSEVLKFSKK